MACTPIFPLPLVRVLRPFHEQMDEPKPSTDESPRGPFRRLGEFQDVPDIPVSVPELRSRAFGHDGDQACCNEKRAR